MYLGDLWLDHGIVKMPRKALCRRFVNVEYLVWIFFYDGQFVIVLFSGSVAKFSKKSILV